MFSRKKITTIIFLFSLFFFAFKSQEALAVDTSSSESRSATEYTLMPLFADRKPASINYEDLLVSMVQDQGYEAHCAQKTWEIDKTIWGEIKAYFDSNNQDYTGPVTFGGIDPYKAEFGQARIPMLRGMETSLDTMKNSSLEGLFGANYQMDGDTYMLNSSGVAQRLLTPYQQCVHKMQNVGAAATICLEVDTTTGSEICTINRKFNLPANPEYGIPATFFKLKDLNAWFEEVRPELSGSERIRQVCTDLTGGDVHNQPDPEYPPPSVDQERLNLISAAVNLVPIDLDTLYRLAFLVIVPQQDPDDSEDKFFMLQESADLNERRHAPIFIAFKIPDFATNKVHSVGNIDTLEISKMVLQSKEKNQLDLENQITYRDQLLAKIKYPEQFPEISKVIRCGGMPQCLHTDGNALRAVVLDIVNATAPNCLNEELSIIDLDSSTEEASESSTVEYIFNQEDLHWEKAGDLFNPASKDLKEYNYFANSNDQAVNKLPSNYEEPFEWELIVDKVNPDKGKNITVNAYIVAPVGETVKDVNKSLAIFWNEDLFVGMIENNDLIDMDGKVGAIPKFLTIKGENTGISTSGKHNFCYEYGVIPVNNPDGTITTEYACVDKKNFGFTLADSKETLLFPDFGLGWMVRKIQETVRATFNDTFAYVQSCKRVEDLFLGRCKGPDEDGELLALCEGESFNKIVGMPSAEGVPQFAKDMFDAEIAGRITTEHIEAYTAAEEATGIPCEIAAGIHWVEGGSNADQSLFDGGALRGDLKSDAIGAMEHLKDKIADAGGSVDSLTYELLMDAIGRYNGLGNQNCGKDTRWLNGGKCPPKSPSEDHPHPLGWIDDRHSDMDLIFCIDFVEFNCSEDATAENLQAVKDRLTEVGGITDPSDLEARAQQAADYCFASGPACQSLSDGNRYPAFNRPGSITTAILLNAAGN